MSTKEHGTKICEECGEVLKCWMTYCTECGTELPLIDFDLEDTGDMAFDLYGPPESRSQTEKDEKATIVNCKQCRIPIKTTFKYCPVCSLPTDPSFERNLAGSVRILYGPPWVFDDANNDKPAVKKNAAKEDADKKSPDEEMIDVILCPNCKSVYPLTSKYCPECGMKPGRIFNPYETPEDFEILYGPPSFDDGE